MPAPAPERECARARARGGKAGRAAVAAAPGGGNPPGRAALKASSTAPPSRGRPCSPAADGSRSCAREPPPCSELRPSRRGEAPAAPAPTRLAPPDPAQGGGPRWRVFPARIERWRPRSSFPDPDLARIGRRRSIQGCGASLLVLVEGIEPGRLDGGGFDGGGDGRGRAEKRGGGEDDDGDAYITGTARRRQILACLLLSLSLAGAWHGRYRLPSSAASRSPVLV